MHLTLLWKWLQIKSTGFYVSREVFLFSGLEIGEKGRAFPFPPRILILFQVNRNHTKVSFRSTIQPPSFLSSLVFSFPEFFPPCSDWKENIERKKYWDWKQRRLYQKGDVGRQEWVHVFCTVPTKPPSPDHRSYHIWFTCPYFL